MKPARLSILTAVLTIGPFTSMATAQEKAAAQPAPAPAPVPPPAAFPAVLPGNGLAQHDFLYAGEAKDRQVFIVRKGKIVWTWEDPAGRGEISDAMLLSNGNVLIAHQYAVKLLDAGRKVLWNLEAPAGTEIHTAHAIGQDHVLLVQNGDPALVRIFNVHTGAVKQEFPLPVRNPKGVHGQFRHARITPAGTLVVAHMDSGKVSEYDSAGRERRAVPADSPWGVTPLPGGNWLITDRKGTREITPEGRTAWEFTRADAPGYQLDNFQLAWRLPNGNTLLNTWFNQWSGELNPATAPVQALELTPDKKIVWALRSWTEPNLGPSTTIQILDEPTAPEKVTFGEFR